MIAIPTTDDVEYVIGEKVLAKFLERYQGRRTVVHLRYIDEKRSYAFRLREKSPWR